MRSHYGLAIAIACLIYSFRCPSGILAEVNSTLNDASKSNLSAPVGHMLMSSGHGHAKTKNLQRLLLRGAERSSEAFDSSRWGASGAETYVDFRNSEAVNKDPYVRHRTGSKEEASGRNIKPSRQPPSVVRQDHFIRSNSGRVGSCSRPQSDGSSFLPASHHAPGFMAPATAPGASSAFEAETWWNCTANQANAVGPPQPMGANLLVIAAPGSGGGSLGAVFAKLAVQRPPLCGRRYDGGTFSGNPGATPPVQVVKAENVKSCAPHHSNLLWGPLALDLEAVARFAAAPPPDPKESQLPKAKKRYPALPSSSTSTHSLQPAHTSHSEKVRRFSSPSSSLAPRAQPLQRRHFRRLRSKEQVLAHGAKSVGSDGIRSSITVQDRTTAAGAGAEAGASPGGIRGQRSAQSARRAPENSASNTRRSGLPQQSSSMSTPSPSRGAAKGAKPPALPVSPSLPGAVYTMVMLREPFDRLVTCARLAGVGRAEFERFWGLRMATNTQTSLVNGVGPLVRGALNDNHFKGHPRACATSPARAAAEACTRLMQTFTVVGVTDKYTESLWLAQRAFGWGEALILEQLSLPRWRSRAHNDDGGDDSSSRSRSDSSSGVGGSSSGSIGGIIDNYLGGGDGDGGDRLGGSSPSEPPLGVVHGGQQPSFTASQVSPSVRARLRSRELCDVEVYEFASDLVTSRLLHAAPQDVERFATFTKRLKSLTLRKAKHDAKHGSQH